MYSPSTHVFKQDSCTQNNHTKTETITMYSTNIHVHNKNSCTQQLPCTQQTYLYTANTHIFHKFSCTQYPITQDLNIPGVLICSQNEYSCNQQVTLFNHAPNQHSCTHLHDMDLFSVYPTRTNVLPQVPHPTNSPSKLLLQIFQYTKEKAR
jgi:hypothetical protein